MRAVARHAALWGCALLLPLAMGCREELPPVLDAPLAVQVQMATNTVHVGEPVDLRLFIDHADGGIIELPDLNRDKQILVRNYVKETAPTGEGRSRTIVDYTLTSFRVGEHGLGTGRVAVAMADGTTLSEPLPEAKLRVASVLGSEDTVLRELKDPVDWPSRLPRWIPGLVIVAILALLAGLLGRWLLPKARRRKREGPPPPPPHEQALAALRALLGKGWIEEEDVEPFYVDLSRIVRRYLEDRFKLHAPEMTTEEFIRSAAESHVLSTQHQLVTREFLEQSDLVKFARHHPDQETMRTAHTSAVHLVEETKPSSTNSTPSTISTSS